MTARFSTSVTPDGTATTTRGRNNDVRGLARWMKWRSMRSVTSKSAMTPSFKGRTATMLPGVRPTIRFASSPTARMLPVSRSMATTDGSRMTMPRPFK